MKDPADQQTADMIDQPSRRPGRPVTGNAKSRAEIQREYRQRKREQSITINLDRELATQLHAHLMSLSEGRSMMLIEPEQAAQLASLIRKAEIQQLSGFVDRPGAKKTRVKR
ncbi:hypothetical protein [Aeromonas sobria]|jgi:hypothetical protein|uniref:hypothetical protein n=1 Tax=Aeromonas sobria TaxID=646 RepID=UPI003F3EB1D6